MKNKKNSIILISLAVILVIASYVLYVVYSDESRLSTLEKEWLTANEKTVISVNVVNNVPIIGDGGKGIFYDFIEDMKLEYNLTINPIAMNASIATNEGAFTVKDKIDSNDLVFYEETFVLLKNQDEIIDDITDLYGKEIATLSENLSRISVYNPNLTLKEFGTFELMVQALNDLEQSIDYMIVPMEQYLEEFLSSNYSVVFHFSDLINYYVYDMPEEQSEFNSVVHKFFLNWSEEDLKDVVNTNTLTAFVNGIGITTKELTDAQAKEYEYGFIDSKPYEVLMGGNYGGVVSEYLRKFSDVTNIDFQFRKYDDVVDFQKAVTDGDLDLYFSYYVEQNNNVKINSGLNLDYVIVGNDSDTVIKSLNSLKDKKVYVLKNSTLSNYLSTIQGIELIAYDSESALKNVASEDSLIAIDSLNYEYYKTTFMEDYTVRYSEDTNMNYNFTVAGNDAFTRLFTRYVDTLDSQLMTIKGTVSNQVTVDNGSTLFNIARYFLVALVLVGSVVFLVYKSNKRVKLSKKIRKDQRAKYIDQLTSLKNRNYLSEHIGSWNKNTIYPQTTIVLDLNKLQEVNDTLGYEHGDLQIKAAANILIKTQLDNSDIIRTDGNEFLIYLVGYQEKQIITYIRKLQKEFKGLPYEHGAAIGYSMILDDIKTLEDAINESVENMKINKEEIVGE